MKHKNKYRNESREYGSLQRERRKEERRKRREERSNYTSSLVSTLQGGDRRDVRKEWAGNVKYGWSGLGNDRAYIEGRSDRASAAECTIRKYKVVREGGSDGETNEGWQSRWKIARI
jgi:hypothetical protein